MKEKISPGMQQYLDIKANYPDAFLLFRMGDFYELFYDDALKAGQILELTVTSRNKNAEKPIPMAGVPYHSAKGYIDTLVENGYKVAIAEQMEDPKQAVGVVRREVVQVITPGTQVAQTENGKAENNYITALFSDTSGKFGFAYADLATGELKATHLENEEAVLNEASALQTKEMILSCAISDELKDNLTTRLQLVFSEQEKILELDEITHLTENLKEPLMLQATNALLSYLHATQMRKLSHLEIAQVYQTRHFLSMDHFSKYNLELTSSIRTGKKHGTLFWLLDETKTAMGSRLLKQWITRPLLSMEKIFNRQNGVESLLNSFFERSEIQDSLKGVYDLERLSGRVAFGHVNAKDLLQLKNSLEQIPRLQAILESINTGEWNDLLAEMDACPDLVDLIQQAIDENAPASITEGNIIKTGYNATLDEYREAMQNGSRWILELEEKERNATGIKTLRIDYNRKDGYFFHVTNSNLSMMKEFDYFYRKATLKNSERYGTEELAKLERVILEATDKSVDLEYQLFLDIRKIVETHITRLKRTAAAVATLDSLASLATVAENYSYKRPTLVPNGRTLEIIDGRHPVVERVLGNNEYIPNSIKMNEATNLLLITGPNMSGKSTYMRQLALTVIMAQIGSFVPAERAVIPLFDKIFTRIGASDDLISGQSTFMVEMMEANQALRHATAQSLILFDELGRGTATYDGMALAQAIIEYIHDNIHAKTLFSTHYHELTALSDSLGELKNVHVGAVEKDGVVHFLHKMMDGAADKSYGIHVAKIAGLPVDLLERAASILSHLENNEQKELPNKPTEEIAQLSLFQEISTEEIGVVDTIKKLNLLEMTPLDALNTLYELQKMI
ncbi:DNA mismatch repair protein MutS [Pilibacter termitis]|uniref:DNA mismatch repair protein MutS n=2 Tax=Pilibacter termitis TaxID=263852 RepID=A0A1T4Q2C6_9ENTE|nr:DNA mismatch repair protein MutS [Pilibacter termitis]